MNIPDINTNKTYLTSKGINNGSKLRFPNYLLMKTLIKKPLDDSTKHLEELNKPITLINGYPLLFAGISKSNLVYKIQKEADITFYKFKSQTLYNNLFLIDSDLPRIVAQLLFYRFKENESNLFELTAILEKENPLCYPQGSDRSYYSYKIKKMLRGMSMGTTAETPWKGDFDTTGGTLVFRDDGEVVCYHIYDIQKFERDLIKNTYLETPSTSKDNIIQGFLNCIVKLPKHF